MRSSVQKCSRRCNSILPSYTSLHRRENGVPSIFRSRPLPLSNHTRSSYQIRSVLSAAVQNRIIESIERYNNILETMKSSGHTSNDVGKELSVLTPIVKLQERMKQLDDEEQSLEELVIDAKQSADAELETECLSELERINKERTKLEEQLIDTVLPKEEDDYESDAIIEIRAGTGGEEASLFSAELLDCYIKTSKSLRWNVEELTASRTDLGGIKEATISISGGATFYYPTDDNDDDNTANPPLGPYGFFKFESGVHRVQRVPINDTRIQTSACSVAVLPLANDTNKNDQELLPMSELRIETMRASGAGGQHINTTDSAVRITHIPTGITASIQDGRSQHKNKEQALKLVTARVRDKQREEEAKRLGETRSTLMGGGDRSERIRTYNYPQDRITDHRCKETVHGIEQLLGVSTVIIDGLVVSFLPHLKSIYREELLNKIQEQEDAKERKNKKSK